VGEARFIGPSRRRGDTFARVRLLASLGAALLSGCTCTLGSLDECTTDLDCVPRGESLTCTDRLCVADARCSSIGPDGGVTFGLLLPLTVDGKTPGANAPHWREVVELAVTELNPPVRPGIKGRPMRYVVCDTTQNATVAGHLAERLVASGVPAIICDGSSETLAIAAAAVPHGVLVLSGSALAPELTTFAASPNGRRLLWRTSTSGSVVMPLLAREIAGAFAGGLPKVAVFERNDALGTGLNSAFSESYAGPHRAFTIEPGGDPRPALTEAVAWGPEVKLVAAFPDDYVRLLNAAEEPAYAALQGLPWYWDDDGRSPAIIAQLTSPGHVEGTIGAGPTRHYVSLANQWVTEHFAQAYGLDPSGVLVLPNFFDTAMLVALAAATAREPLTGDALADQLALVSASDAGTTPLDPPHFNDAVARLAAGGVDIDGASGPLDFDPASGQAPNVMDLWQVHDGGFVILRVVPP
jgi:branched-chain amino acid transport system substrate-binding protein